MPRDSLCYPQGWTVFRRGLLPRREPNQVVNPKASVKPRSREFGHVWAMTATTRDTGFHAVAYWHLASNWKKCRFRNLLFLNNFHRGTHLGCITWFRDFWASSRLLGPNWARVSPAICSPRFTPTVAKPYIPVRNKEGSLGLTSEPSCNRDGLWHPSEWRRRESNPRPVTFPCQLLRV